ncbi:MULTISPECIES: carcinine hydrolase/isopenicillin-N N-acyltransferase family protein [Gracilibacillus]|uniref:carcinine hydrolase/isopenicillin-N N-acyltransferase family protein n=1 Tax=Gracilibacillus TaxID=74385 RepID=UPI0008250368|nr:MULTISPECIES: carcinine hydrolase/isopenicillin-N N-acyltransferase family protein [Gracilibacillus]
MCTMFMKRDQENALLFAAKTVDTPDTVLTFDYQPSSLQHNGYFFFKMGWQEGINSGMNEAGLAVLSSYASLTEHPPSKNSELVDTRGTANEYVLQHCSHVQDGLQTLERQLQQTPSDVGGIHFLVDANYTIGILEHDPVTREIQQQIIADNSVIRANHPLLLKGRGAEGSDRSMRYEKATQAIENIQGKAWLAHLQELLSQHVAPGEDQLGQLCIHQFENTGSRSKDLTPHSTATALIFDVANKRFIYSEGSPCNGQWKILSMDEKVVR